MCYSDGEIYFHLIFNVHLYTSFANRVFLYTLTITMHKQNHHSIYCFQAPVCIKEAQTALHVGQQARPTSLAQIFKHSRFLPSCLWELEPQKKVPASLKYPETQERA